MATDRPNAPSAASISDTLREASRRMTGWTYRGDADPDPRILMVEAAAELERLRDLVVRFRQWDDLPGRADGPYWMSEADKVLGDA